MIRPATKKDVPNITKIFNYYIKNSAATFEEDEVSEVEMLQRVNKVSDSGYLWLVALECDEVIGFAYSSLWNERSAYRATSEVSVYVSDSMILKGWGTKLYDVLFQHLKQQGVHTVVSGLTLPHPASVALHEKFGMQKIAHFRQVGYKFNEWHDVAYWQVMLNDKNFD